MSRTRFTLILAAALAVSAFVLSAGVSTGLAAIIYVKHDATGANNGTSWTDAFVEIQDGMSAASAGDQIWVAVGRYTPDRGVGITQGDRLVRVMLKTDVALYGGFAGTETSLAGRAMRVSETILTCDLAGDDGPNFSNRGENAYGFFRGNFVTGAVIDGFTITAGYKYEYSAAAGAVYSYTSQIAVRNCIMTDHWVNHIGGAIWAGFGSALEVTNCRIQGSVADHGAAVAFSSESTGVFTNCLIVGNHSNFVGGVVFAQANSRPRFVNCTIVGNSAPFSGALSEMWDGAESSFDNCILWENNGPTLTQGPLTVRYSCGEAGWTGPGNIYAPPVFLNLRGPDGIVGTADDNLRLAAGSPGVDAGSNSLISADVKTDLDGAPRFFDAPAGDVGAGPPPIVDMGAYEFHTTPPMPGDVNGDHAVNSFDIDPFVVAILNPNLFWSIYPTGDFRNADINLDGRVNNFDIDAFVTALIGP